MARLLASLGLGLLAAGAPAGASAADWDTYGGGYGLRGAIVDYDDAYIDPLGFEIGARYWYSLGHQSGSLWGESVEANDTSHILEGHFRIDDWSTDSFLKGAAGYAFAVDGAYSTSLLPGQSAPFSGGQVGYAGADFGYQPFGNDAIRVGGLVGYQYMLEAPDRARTDLFEIEGLNVHALRLGLVGRADFGMVDLTAEAVAIPFAQVDGEMGFTGLGYDHDGDTIDTLHGELTGSLYGAAGEVMLGFHPSENLTLRLGARGWFLTGPATASVAAYDDGTEVWSGDVLIDAIDLFRYGALVELTGRF